MDALDRLILGELSLRCRVSFTELAKKFDVSLTTIKNRVEELVEEGVIQNFVAQLPLQLMGANIAIIALDIKTNTLPNNLVNLGGHPFIMALGLGYELQGFAISIYRTNDELRQAVDHLQSSGFVERSQAYPVALPPAPVDRSQAKGIDALKNIDWKILKSLQWNARKTLSDIASDVGASVPTVRKRLNFMRKHNLIQETIQINPAAAERQIVVMLLMRNPNIAQMDPFEFEKMLRTKFSESYWISFRMANRPEFMLTFVIDSSKQVSPIRSELVSLFEGTEIFNQMIVPQWTYFPDFRDEIIDKRLSVHNS